jgi:hypothetical protein
MDELLRQAIAERRLVAFVLDGYPRIGEPHDYGIINGTAKLFFFQTGGRSRSQPPVGWRWATLSKMSDLKLLEQHFAGPRPAPSGRHIHWDELIASVFPRG